MKNDPVYTVLPPGELFSPTNAGAVAIVVHSMCELSSINSQIIGDDCGEPFNGCEFSAVKPFMYRFRSRSRAYAQSCKSFLQRQPSGIVEVHNRIPLFLYLESKLKQHAYCLYLHNDPQGMKGGKSVEDRQVLLEKASAIYVVSHYIKARFMEGLSGGGEKVHVLYNGVSFSQQSELILECKKQQILFVGRIIPEKGVLEFAKALKQVLPVNPMWRAVFIGARHFGNTKPTTAYERDVLRELENLDEQIEYKNALPHQEVMQCYQASEIAVVPSIWNEPFGRTALEAIVSHCALVSSNRGGLSEVIGDTALLIDPEDPSAIACAIQKLIDQPDERNGLRARAYDRATDMFSQSIIVRQHDEIRKSILETLLK